MNEEQKEALFNFCENVEKVICSTMKDCEQCYTNGTCFKYLLAELRDSLGLEKEVY